MDHVNILKRAWRILMGCKALWFFGFFLALTTSSWGWVLMSSGRDEGGSNLSFSFTLPDGKIIRIPGPNQLQWEGGIPDEVISALITIGIVLLCMVLFFAVVSLVVRYISETALIRMVNVYEETGESCKIGQGLRLGFARCAIRFFLIDLVVILPTILLFILLFALSIAPFFLWMTENNVLGVIGTVAGVGLFFLMIFLAIVVGAALTLLRDFFKRACALEGKGVFASISRGFTLVRRNLKDAGLMWLVMTGIRLGWPLLMVPVALLLVSIAILFGGAAGLLVSWLSNMVFTGYLPNLMAGIAGLTVILLIVGFPLAFLTGLRDTYVSTTWTLTYRDLHRLESIENNWLPELEDQEM